MTARACTTSGAWWCSEGMKKAASAGGCSINLVLIVWHAHFAAANDIKLIILAEHKRFHFPNDVVRRELQIRSFLNSPKGILHQHKKSIRCDLRIADLQLFSLGRSILHLGLSMHGRCRPNSWFHHLFRRPSSLARKFSAVLRIAKEKQWQPRTSVALKISS